ncbi:MAG: hypothetical protein ABSB35_30735 [Bryobacteraceae bacterium]
MGTAQAEAQGPSRAGNGAPLTVNVAASAPGIFTADASGVDQAVAVNNL